MTTSFQFDAMVRNSNPETKSEIEFKEYYRQKALLRQVEEDCRIQQQYLNGRYEALLNRHGEDPFITQFVNSNEG